MVCGLGCLAPGGGSLEELLRQPCTSLDNWDDIKDEIKRSNILQRDSHIFAKRLDSRLETYAKEVDKKAKNNDKLWTKRSRREMLDKIIEKWLETVGEGATVKKLMSALGAAGHMDVRLKVTKLLEKNCQEEGPEK